ncbi:MAG: acyl-CoA dehydrogenase family protein, partial [Labilithrix sp.]|nr:acyl-CoA dehydrogenase family protein [Labilithrix sp.]
MDFELTETQRDLQREARGFAERELLPHAARWDSASTFPRETLFHAGRLGFCGLYADERHGGLGKSRLDASIVFEELAAACPSTTAFLTIHNMATWVITRWARADVAARWARQLTSGRALASYCLTEPHAGSDAASLATTAARDGRDFVLDGTKAFVSGAGVTDALLVLARTGEAGPRGISAFLVPADTRGVTFGCEEDKLGWHSQPTRSITFDAVRVPGDHLLGEEGEGFRVAMKGLDGERVSIAT